MSVVVERVAHRDAAVDPAFESAVRAEGVANARRLSLIRVVGTGMLLVATVVFGNLVDAGGWWKGGEPATATWFGISLVLFVLSRLLPLSGPLAWLLVHATAWLDVPAIFAMEWAIMPNISDPMTMVAANSSNLLMLVFFSAFVLRWHVVVLTGIVGAVAHGFLQHEAGIASSELVTTAILFAVWSAMCIFGARQLASFVQRTTAEMVVRASTERELAERRETETRLRLFSHAVEQSSASIVITDPEHHIEFVNPAFARASGYGLEEVLGKTPQLLQSGMTPGSTYDEMRAALAAGLSWTGEFVNRRKNGEFYFEKATISPVRDSEGVLAHYVAIKEDVSERKQAEADLRDAIEAAEQANRAKSEFLSRMSHELRTPLNAILGFAQLLELDASTPEQKEGVARILQGGKHLVGLVEEVLDVARIEAGRLALTLAPVSLRTAVQNVLRMVSVLAEARDVELVFRGELRGVTEMIVLADAQRLRQVLLNLVSNAIKYNRPGGSVSIDCDEPIPGLVVVSVKDTGIGIDPAHVERLFRPFERLGLDKSDIEGTGLGLAVTKGLVEAMGGKIEVESRRGEGSTFRVTLPLARPRGEETEPSIVVAEPTPPPQRSRTIVQVEDNAANRLLVERVLGMDPGVNVLSATDGEAGLQLIGQALPDLVLLDSRMPRLSGRQVLEKLKADPATAHIPVLVVSADADRASRQDFIEGGAREYMTKPLDILRFRDLVYSLLEEGDDEPDL